jgi:hypothetical protein
LKKDFPAVICHLKLIQIKGGEIVHKVTFDLTAKDVNLGAKDVE